MDKVGKTDSHFSIEKMGSFFISTKKESLENAPNPFVGPCIVSGLNLPGAPPLEASEVGEPYDGQLSPAVRRGLGF
ncbi:LOW QUALITY PROTEIN: hypothetical protein CFC21_083318 [Triticum aestivum]|uniref:Uncharacterized protein n=2 Tax=Triticum aestivum TaxID=4565 RepID=A0A9R1I8I3_WHEAT|nr:LOW QUALITY PROTEIN: hypothetical protein CFC21_083318 [Triticum aestivum]